MIWRLGGSALVTPLLVALLLVTTACGTGPTTTTTGEAPIDGGRHYVTVDGQQIEVVNPSTDTVRLLDWAFSRFQAAGLLEPMVDRIHFGDETPGCTDRSGWTRQTDVGIEMAICLAADRLCQSGIGSPLRTPAKFCVLHELAHGWIIAHLSDETRAVFLDHVGLADWMATSDETPWHRRGAEYAAEVVAWGLMDDLLELIRLETPDCIQLQTRFTILTGAIPLVRCAVDG